MHRDERKHETRKNAWGKLRWDEIRKMDGKYKQNELKKNYTWNETECLRRKNWDHHHRDMQGGNKCEAGWDGVSRGSNNRVRRKVVKGKMCEPTLNYVRQNDGEKCSDEII